jgi:hypothetical protein
LESLKIKCPNGTVFNKSNFSQGNTKEYLVHIIAALCLINQKGLNVQCRKLAKTIDKVARMPEKLQEAVAAKCLFPKDEMESCKLESGQMHRCYKNPRRFAARQLLRRTSFWGTSCLMTHSPNGIESAARWTIVTGGLE